MNDSAFQPPEDIRNVLVGQKDVNRHFVVLIYTKYFHHGKKFVDWNRYEDLEISLPVGTVKEKWSSKDPCFVHLFNSVKCFNLKKEDHLKILSSHYYEFTVLLNSLSSFYKVQVKPARSQLYFSSIRILNDNWIKITESIPEVSTLDEIFSRRSSSKLIKFNVLNLNEFLGNNSKSSDNKQPSTSNDQPSTPLNNYNSIEQPSTSFDQSSTLSNNDSSVKSCIFSQELVFSQESIQDSNQPTDLPSVLIQNGYYCTFCDLYFSRLQFLEEHLDNYHRVISIFNSSLICFNCTGFVFQLGAFESKQCRHNHNDENGNLIKRKYLKFDLSKDEKRLNLRLAIVESKILIGLLVPEVVEAFFTRYVKNNGKINDEDRNLLKSAWNEYMKFKQIFNGTFSNGRSYCYEGIGASLVADSINKNVKLDLIWYVNNRDYNGSAQFNSDTLLKTRMASHKLSRMLFIDYNMLSRVNDSRFLENNQIRVFRKGPKNIKMINQISGANYIYQSNSIIKNYELIAISRINLNYLKFVNKIRPLIKVKKERLVTIDDVLNLNEKYLNEEEAKRYIELKLNNQIEINVKRDKSNQKNSEDEDSEEDLYGTGI